MEEGNPEIPDAGDMERQEAPEVSAPRPGKEIAAPSAEEEMVAPRAVSPQTQTEVPGLR